MVNANGQPHNAFRIQAENCELSSDSSTAQSLVMWTSRADAFQRNGNIRPNAITPTHDSSTTAATHLAAAGALSPALTFQSGFDKEKYRTAVAPIEMKTILGANPMSP